jgi:hypothetical protein
MTEKNISSKGIKKLKIDSVGGNLYLNGWNSDEIRIKNLTDQDQLTEKKTLVSATFIGDAIIHLPLSLDTQIGSVGGSASIRGINSALEIKTVGGDLSLIDVGSVQTGTVGGDLISKKLAGDLQAENIGGDGLGENIKGQISLKNVGGDVHLEKIAGGIEVSCGGDARLNFQPVSWQAYQATAGGDISAAIPDDSSAELSLNSGEEDITVILGDLEIKHKEAKLDKKIGEGGPTIILTAGGKVFLSGDDFSLFSSLKMNAEELENLAVDFSNETADQFKHHLDNLEINLDDSISRLSDSLDSFGISEENLQRFSAQIEESSRRAAHKAEIAAIKAQAKVEKRIAQARKKAAMIKTKTKEFDLDQFLASQEKKRSVSPDERILILNMLQEKKISPEEADDLLQALEGKK